jgi:hypothetical protein
MFLISENILFITSIVCYVYQFLMRVLDYSRYEGEVHTRTRHEGLEGE